MALQTDIIHDFLVFRCRHLRLCEIMLTHRQMTDYQINCEDNKNTNFAVTATVLKFSIRIFLHAVK